MSNALSITTNLTTDNKIEILASVVEGGTLPKDIFIYKNTGTSTLGYYVGVCDIDEYRRLQTFTGEVIPMFGNQFVKSTQAKILLDITDDPNTIVKHLTNTITFLSFALLNSASTTQIINIP